MGSSFGLKQMDGTLLRVADRTTPAPEEPEAPEVAAEKAEAEVVDPEAPADALEPETSDDEAAPTDKDGKVPLKRFQTKVRQLHEHRGKIETLNAEIQRLQGQLAQNASTTATAIAQIAASREPAQENATDTAIKAMAEEHPELAGVLTTLLDENRKLRGGVEQSAASQRRTEQQVQSQAATIFRRDLEGAVDQVLAGTKFDTPDMRDMAADIATAHIGGADRKTWAPEHTIGYTVQRLKAMVAKVGTTPAVVKPKDDPAAVRKPGAAPPNTAGMSVKQRARLAVLDEIKRLGMPENT